MAADMKSGHRGDGKRRRNAMWATGVLLTGGGGTAGVAVALDHPGLGRLALTVAAVLVPVLAVAAVLVLVLAVALIGPDKDRSRFDRIMSFTGLMLCRTPGQYVLPPVSRTPPTSSNNYRDERTPSPGERQSVS